MWTVCGDPKHAELEAARAVSLEGRKTVLDIVDEISRLRVGLKAASAAHYVATQEYEALCDAEAEREGARND